MIANLLEQLQILALEKPGIALALLFQRCSEHFQAEPGIRIAFKKEASLRLYLSQLEQVFYPSLQQALEQIITSGVKTKEFSPVDVGAFCEIFIAVNKHFNQKDILQEWTAEESEKSLQLSLQVLTQTLGIKNLSFQVGGGSYES